MNKVFMPLVLVALVGACGAPKPDADSTAVLAPPDTVKAGPPSAEDSSRPPSGATADAGGSSSGTKTGTKAGETSSTKQTPGPLRDSVIQFDLRDPRRQIPPDDTTKRARRDTL
jgi:hypothetical protein